MAIDEVAVIGGAVAMETLKTFGRRFLREREERGLRNVASERSAFEHYIAPMLGSTPLDRLRPKQIQAWLREVKKRKLEARRRRTLVAMPQTEPDVLAPRTVRKAFQLLRSMLNEAVADELIVGNPAVLRRGDLPAKIDKDPTWRRRAVFSRSEVELLISSPGIPLDRRVFYALYFLTGMRTCEGAALRWRDYERNVDCLGCFTVARSYDRKTGRVK